MIEIKYMSKFETKLLKGVPNFRDLETNYAEIYRRYLVADIRRNEYLYSGEAHIYEKNCTPVVFEGRKPVAIYSVLPDEWARLMVQLYSGVYDSELKIHEFRADFTIPKFIKVKYPM